MTRDITTEARRLALTTDALDVFYPNAGEMTEQELEPIYRQLSDANLTETCPYCNCKFSAKDAPRFIMVDAHGALTVGTEPCIKARSIREKGWHALLTRVLEPIKALYEPKRRTREAEEARVYDVFLRVSEVVNLLRAINARDNYAMADDLFAVWLMEVAEDRQIPAADVETYWAELKRREEAEAMEQMEAEEAQRLTATSQTQSRTEPGAELPPTDDEDTVDDTLPVAQMPEAVAMAPETPMDNTDALPVPVVESQIEETASV